MKIGALTKKAEQPECAPGEHRRRSTAPVSAAALDRAVRTFRALGDPPRLRLLAILAQGELCVSEIAEIADDGLSTVSQRLRVLRSAERRNDCAMARGLAFLKTPLSRSSALLRRVTAADHRRVPRVDFAVLVRAVEARLAMREA